MVHAGSEISTWSHRVGTEACLAPELVRTFALMKIEKNVLPPYSPATDLYAWGASLYYLTQGRYVKGLDMKSLESPQWQDDFLFGDIDSAPQLLEFIRRCINPLPTKRWKADILKWVCLHLYSKFGKVNDQH